VKSYDQFCGLAQALDHVGDRWTMLIVRELLIGPRRFTDLEAALPGVATNLLAARLRSLEADGLAVRDPSEMPGSPRRYRLTPDGEGLRPAVMELIRWGGRWMTPRRPGLTFRPEWLALALAALAAPDRLPRDATWEFVTEGRRARFRLESTTVHAAATTPEPPDLLITGDSSAIMATAAGVVPLDDAIASGKIRLEGTSEAQGVYRRMADAARERAASAA
jgi:DNA-binding HxlR family transcriptional regulator